MKSKTYFGVTCLLFSIIAVVHALRLLNGWSVQIGSATIPLWISWLGLLLAGYLAYSGYKLKSGK